jgi:geranylgeranylglycerol-phosphate geranylgeranyltransferase
MKQASRPDQPQAAIDGPRSATVLRTMARLMRVEKPLCATAFVFLGAWLGGAPVAALAAPRMGLAAACIFFITAFGFVINDCCDWAVDTIGKPGRPLPSRQVSLRAARVYALALAAAGVACGLLLGGLPTLVAFAATALSAAYSYRLKSTLLLGNASVALLVSAVLVFGALVAGTTTPAVWQAAGITFCYIVAQEALFTLDDEEEDRAAGLHTTATVLGTESAGRLVRALLLLFIAVAPLPWARGQAGAAYIVALAALSLAPAAVLWCWLCAPIDRARVARAVRLSRLVWLTSFLPLALLR